MTLLSQRAKSCACNGDHVFVIGTCGARLRFGAHGLFIYKPPQSILLGGCPMRCSDEVQGAISQQRVTKTYLKRLVTFNVTFRMRWVPEENYDMCCGNWREREITARERESGLCHANCLLFAITRTLCAM